METRVVQIEEGWWRIRTDQGEISSDERDNVVRYFNEIRFPYRIRARRVCVPESIPWAVIEESLLHFYDGWAELYRF